MDMKKISASILFVLALCIGGGVISCDNAATPENDYLAPLLGTWETDMYEEEGYVLINGTERRASYTFTRTDLVMNDQVRNDNMRSVSAKIKKVEATYFILEDGSENKTPYNISQENGKTVLYINGTFGPLYKTK